MSYYIEKFYWALDKHIYILAHHEAHTGDIVQYTMLKLVLAKGDLKKICLRTRYSADSL